MGYCCAPWPSYNIHDCQVAAAPPPLHFIQFGTTFSPLAYAGQQVAYQPCQYYFHHDCIATASISSLCSSRVFLAPLSLGSLRFQLSCLLCHIRERVFHPFLDAPSRLMYEYRKYDLASTELVCMLYLAFKCRREVVFLSPSFCLNFFLGHCTRCGIDSSLSCVLV